MPPDFRPPTLEHERPPTAWERYADAFPSQDPTEYALPVPASKDADVAKWEAFAAECVARRRAGTREEWVVRVPVLAHEPGPTDGDLE